MKEEENYMLDFIKSALKFIGICILIVLLLLISLVNRACSVIERAIAPEPDCEICVMDGYSLESTKDFNIEA